MPSIRPASTSCCNQVDGTENKSNLGANAILGVSMAVAKAAAASSGMPLYRYIGGVNAHVLPDPDDEYPERRQARRQQHRFAGVHDPADRRADASPRPALGRRGLSLPEQDAQAKGYATNVGDEGGFAPSLKSNAEAIEVILEAIEKAGYKPGEQISHRTRSCRQLVV